MNSTNESTNEPVKILTAAEAMARRINQLGFDIVAVAKDVVRDIDAQTDDGKPRNPNYVKELEALGINRILIYRLERFGRNEIDERLVLQTGSGARALIRMPLSEQRRVLAEGLDILEDDEQNTRRIPFDSLTPKQVYQGFAQDHVRTLAEQKTYIRSKRPAWPEGTPTAEYKVFHDHVVTRRGGTWTKQVILGWLQQMA
jgi:hypothetical protein